MSDTDTQVETPEEEVVRLRRMVTVLETENEELRNRSRNMHEGWLADMDRWAAREQWLFSQIPPNADEPES